jgi:hypothetical protein
LLAFIPDPSDLSTVGAGTSASGIAADAMGNVYAADVNRLDALRAFGAARRTRPPR